jgi:hypothetical protein
MTEKSPSSLFIEESLSHLYRKEHWKEILFESVDEKSGGGNSTKIGQRLGLPFVRSLQTEISVRLIDSASASDLKDVQIHQDGTGIMGISGVVWDCGLLLVDFLVYLFQSNCLGSFASNSILDVGCGTGICGIAALYLGCNHVVFTDSFLAISLETNLENLPSHLQYTNDQRKRHEFLSYTWGNVDVPESFLHKRDSKGLKNGEISKMNWDILLCSDLLYESKNHLSLLEFLSHLNYSMALFSYKQRHEKEEKLFFERLCLNHSIHVIDCSLFPVYNLPKDSLDSRLFLILALRI